MRRELSLGMHLRQFNQTGNAQTNWRIVQFDKYTREKRMALRGERRMLLPTPPDDGMFFETIKAIFQRNKGNQPFGKIG